MFDTMTLTKTVGALCGSLLILLFGGWAAEAIYHGGGGHGDGHEQAYRIDTGEEEAEAAEEEAGPDFAELFANADTGKGERVFNKCKACHTVEEGENRVGPHLYGVVGRQVDAVDGFAYSGALEEAAEIWTPENLDHFLAKPSSFAPGTIMSFAGLSSAEDRANVIAFLDRTDGDTYRMDADTDSAQEPAAEPEAEEPKAGEAAEEATEEAATEEPAEEAEADTPAATEEASADEPAEEPAAEEMAAKEPAADEPAEEAAAQDGGSEPASGFAALVAAADPAEGEKVYRQCKACHVADEEQNRVGPHLVGIVGREVAAVDGFSYSDALIG
ncbi:MAG: c-type cytochrome, partial [Roseovarius sp.]|nr:c-type cytochrome [Roseovarius sp.]